MHITRFILKLFYLLRAALVPVFGVIGLAGVPADVQTWSGWLRAFEEYANQDIARWVFLILAIALFASLFPLKTIFSSRKNNAQIDSGELSTQSLNQEKRGKFYLVDVLFEGILAPNRGSKTVGSRNFIVLEVKAEHADLINCKAYMVSAEKIDEDARSKETANVPKPIELRWLCDKNLKAETIPEEEIAKLALLRTHNAWLSVGEKDPLTFCTQPGYPIDYPPTLDGFFETCNRYRVGLRLTADNADNEEFFIEFYFCREQDKQHENRINKIDIAKILPYRG